jgi:hypothetical protein
MNLIQQWGLIALGLGAVLGFLRVTNAPLPKWNLNGGTLLVTLPPDWVLLALLVGGLVLIVAGTVWRTIRGEHRGTDEEVRRE